MARLLIRAVVLSAAFSGLAALAACSGGGGGGDTSDPGAACEEYAKAELGSLQRCAGETLPADVVAGYVAQFKSLCAEALSLPGTGETPQQLSACSAAQSSVSCHSSQQPAACVTPTGSLADDSPCNTGAQCKSGVCVISNSSMVLPDGGVTTTDNTCGKCTPSVALGQACGGTSSAQCAPGGDCVGGLCVAVASVDIGGACNGSEDCKSGLACVSQKCAALGDVGAACQFAENCKDGLVCSSQKCATPVALGGACKAIDECATGLVCDSGTMKCASITLASPGGACSLKAPVVTCAIGACNVTDLAHFTGTCPTLIADGQPCDTADKTKRCGYLSSCKTTGTATTGTCTPPLATVCK